MLSLSTQYRADATRRGDSAPVSGPSDLLESLNAGGRKGLPFQRYKGLGEMNEDQLWETTLNRDARSLSQVNIREVDEANDMFVKRMGDLVEPRREFIQDNALTGESGCVGGKAARPKLYFLVRRTSSARLQGLNSLHASQIGA